MGGTHRWCTWRSGWCAPPSCLQILLKAVCFLLFCWVFFFLINDSFLAFVTSSSLLVVGTKWSSCPLLPALPVQETDFRKPLSVSRWGPLQLWFSLQTSENGGFCCPQNPKQPLGLVKTRSTPVYSLLSSCTSFLALKDANGYLNREQSRRWESSRMTLINSKCQ